MDANGSRFWQLAEAAAWPAREHMAWDATCRSLSLASERTLAEPADAPAAFSQAVSALERCPRSIDAHGAVAYWSEEAGAIMVSSRLPEPVIALPLDSAPSDLAVGHDGILYVALASGILMHDLRQRWDDVLVTAPGFTPWRITSHHAGGIWAMERVSGRLARLTGRPLPHEIPQTDDYAPGVFRPAPENCHPPGLDLMPDLLWAANERPLALAEHSEGGLVLLSWRSDGEARVRRYLVDSRRLEAAQVLSQARYAYALCWLDGQRIAVRLPQHNDAPAFLLANSGSMATLTALGEIYPINAAAIEAPFAHYVEGAARYAIGAQQVMPLLPLSLANLATRGRAANFAGSGSDFRARLIDSGTPATVWHRLYLEAALPAHTGITLWLAATNEPRPPAQDDLSAWHAHGFGADIVQLDPSMRAPHLPRGVWENAASELPAHPGLAAWEREPSTRGLFSVLVQRAGSRVRELVGRYLWVSATFFGDGRASPNLVALRAYASRFSYAAQYLPRVYRESLHGAPAELPGELVDRIDNEWAPELDAVGAGSGVIAGALAARIQLALPDATAPFSLTLESLGRRWLLREATGLRAWRMNSEVGGIGIYRPQASAADFLSRSLANFEGLLTQMEDRVAAAHLYSDPDAVPPENLDWLAGWLGVSFDQALPEARRREWLRQAEPLARWHGTRRGLALALDIATGGAVRGGEIIIIEDFRMRRILATLLGVELSEQNDPLLPGLIQSGNSIVGDTLVLGDHETIELMALFREDQSTAAENDAATAFYGQLAHRATVLVHRDVEEQDLGLIRRIVALEAPAHVDVRVRNATWPLMVGVASLVGVDTYLGPPVAPRPARINRSILGGGDFVMAPATLDPRLRGAAGVPAGPRPQAAATAPDLIVPGASFTLDGSASRAASNRTITEYIWRLLPPDAES